MAAPPELQQLIQAISELANENKALKNQISEQVTDAAPASAASDLFAAGRLVKCESAQRGFEKRATAGQNQSRDTDAPGSRRKSW